MVAALWSSQNDGAGVVVQYGLPWEGRVHKASIGKRWTEGTIDAATRPTIAAAFFPKTMHSQRERVLHVQVWDTAGQEEFRSLAPIYYKDSQAEILVYSVTDRTSFDNVYQWRNELIVSQGGHQGCDCGEHGCPQQ